MIGLLSVYDKFTICVGDTYPILVDEIIVLV